MPSTTGNAEPAPSGTEPTRAGPAVPLVCRGVREGDRRAFTALYEVWYPRWLRDARLLLGREDPLAYDIVQDAFVRVIRRLPELQTEAALAAWMGRTLRSSAVDVLRKESRRRARERTRVRSDEVTAAHDDARWIGSALAALEAGDVLLLRARVVEELTLEQAGRATGVSADAAHGRIRRALARLREAWRGTHE